ncbi:unnamed protein product [Cuscuta campestris]|uniref:E3 ubiquitin-protein ligase RMA n=1 Tax=Cuscuta campestris TaxID=132261 RepID=A0A484KZV0_9ASTE|nr:unnamed protein product [Cuscuta campestris]
MDSGKAGESSDVEWADFECNICFELACDPIVTLCGHLYCWPCLHQWLQVHSRSHECPVCKAIIKEERLVPIYGRGKACSDPRTRLATRRFPNRSRQDEEMEDFMQVPNAAARFGNLTLLSSLFESISSVFTLHAERFHDATVYGATTGAPYMFSSSFHGVYSHGVYHDGEPVEGRRFFLKTFLYIAAFLLVFSLVLF